MIERPILFSGLMVRAILEGRKTQTRRPVTKPIVLDWLEQFLPEFVAAPENDLSPYGYAGDRLWVREAWLRDRYDGSTQYRASHPCPSAPKWKPSIHMPRDRCRLMLDVMDVELERLQDIAEDDAQAEGVDAPTAGSYRAGYAVLWDSLNAKRGYGWDTNPWVWVITFDRAEQMQAAA